MKFHAALTLLASASYLASVLCLPLADNSGDGSGINANATTINPPTQCLAKRQNQQLLTVVMFAVAGIANNFNGENLSRSQYTQELVTTLHSAVPTYNYVICDINNDFFFQGTQAIDWDHVVIEDQNQIYYDVVVGGAGEFTRYADGDWAYIGNVASTTNTGSDATIVFNAP